jgi:NADPH2:quinone reductase
MSKTGIRIVLPKFADTPQQAIDELLTIEEMAMPDTAELKPTDVLVAIRSSAVAFVDFIMMTGQYQHMAPPPYTPGLEYSGEVIWTGSDVDRFAVGDRVMSDFMAVGPRSGGDYQRYGGWASYAVAPQDGVLPLPADFDFDAGCALLANYETPYFALVKRADIQPGESVLITGASGAAGMAAVQMAKLLGARVIVTGRSDAKLALVKDQGADHVINTATVDGEPPRFRKLVRDCTEGEGVDVVYDTVGGSIGEEALRSLAFGGRYVVVGWASNVSDSGGRANFVPDRLPTNIVQMKCLQIMGSPMAIYAGRHPEWRRRQVRQILDWAGEGRLRPYISHCFPLREFREAAHAKLEGAVTGSCILQVRS